MDASESYAMARTRARSPSSAGMTVRPQQEPAGSFDPADGGGAFDVEPEAIQRARAPRAIRRPLVAERAAHEATGRAVYGRGESEYYAMLKVEEVVPRESKRGEHESKGQTAR